VSKPKPKCPVPGCDWWHHHVATGAGRVTVLEDAWARAIRPRVILAEIEARLTAEGAVIELRQLQGLSAQELDLLLALEVHQPQIDPDTQGSPWLAPRTDVDRLAERGAAA
jgi:hypothetical protein